jgi:uncharacterized protein (DUF2336 family)
MPTITAADVDRLVTNRSVATRSYMAARVASLFREATLGPKERAIAEDILRALVEDAAVRVREAVSLHLKRCPFLPHDLAVTLAEDVDSVAGPLLEFSEVLSDADLIRIVRDYGAAKQCAIARRPTVTADVSDALIDTKDEEVVVTLVKNDGARILEPSLHKIVDAFADSEAVNEAMVHRQELPLTVASRLIAVVSDSLRQYLVARHDIPSDLAADVTTLGREGAIAELVSPDADQDQVHRLIRDLHRLNRLTPTLLLRVLCNGQIEFFEAGLAALAAMPPDHTRRLLWESWPHGFDALYRRTGLPRKFHAALRTAVEVILAPGGPSPDDAEKARRLRHLLRAISAEHGASGPENLEMVLSRLQRDAHGHDRSVRH